MSKSNRHIAPIFTAVAIAMLVGASHYAFAAEQDQTADAKPAVTATATPATQSATLPSGSAPAQVLPMQTFNFGFHLFR